MSHNKFHSDDRDLQRIIDGLNREPVKKWTIRELKEARLKYHYEGATKLMVDPRTGEPITGEYVISDEELIKGYLLPALGVDADLRYGEKEAIEVLYDVVQRGIYSGIIPPQTTLMMPSAGAEREPRLEMTEYVRMSLNVYHAAKKNLFRPSELIVKADPDNPELIEIGLLVDRAQSIIDRFPGSALHRERTKDYTRALIDSELMGDAERAIISDSGKGTPKERADIALFLARAQAVQFDVEDRSLHPSFGAGNFYSQSVKVIEENLELYKQGVSYMEGDRGHTGLQTIWEATGETEAGTRRQANIQRIIEEAISDPKGAVADAFARYNQPRTVAGVTGTVQKDAYRVYLANTIGAIEDLIQKGQIEEGWDDEKIAEEIFRIADAAGSQLEYVMKQAVTDQALQTRQDEQAALATDKGKAETLLTNLLYQAGIPPGSITEDHKQEVLSNIQAGVSQKEIQDFLDSKKKLWQEEKISRALVARKPGTDTGPFALEVLNSLGIVSPFATERERAFYAPAEEQIRTLFQIAGEGDPSIYQAGAEAFAEDVFASPDPFTPGYGITSEGLAQRPWAANTVLPGREHEIFVPIEDLRTGIYRAPRMPSQAELDVFAMTDPKTKLGQEAALQQLDPTAPPSILGAEPVWEMMDGREVNIAAPPSFPSPRRNQKRGVL